MEREQLFYYLSTLHRFTGVPFVYGNNAGQVRHFQPFQLNGTENTLEFIAARLQKVTTRYTRESVLYLLHPSMVMLGIVVCHQTGEFVLVGPIASSFAKSEGIEDYLFEAGLPPEATKKLSAYMTAESSWSPDMLKELLVNINTVMNHEILSTEEITILADPETKVRTEFNRSELRSEERSDQKNTVLIAEYTAKMNYCVLHGDLIGLAELITNLGSLPQDESRTPSLREEKLNAFGSIFALEAVASGSGIPASAMETTKKYYLTRIDDAGSIAVVHQMIVSAMFDFTKHVKTYLADSTDDPTINRAMSYIKSNINTKLLCEDIASALHISPHYLFTRFKSATGRTVNEYINQEKIKKACYYMMFTDRSTADIADYLSFSSQSYFQLVFKKVTGMTPREWRSQHLSSNIKRKK